MGFFGYNDTQVISNSNTTAGKKAKEISNNMQATMESMRLEKELQEQSEAFNREMLFEENAKNLTNRSSIERRKIRKENLELEKTLTKKVLVKYLSEMVMDGLVFDEDFMDYHKDSIQNEMTRIFNECYDSKVINGETFVNSSSELMQESFYELQEAVKYVLDNRDSINVFNEDVVDFILNEAPKSKDTAKEIADEVKGKVEDTIEKEKKISTKKKEERDKEDDEKEKEKEENDPEVDDAADSLDNDVDEETGDDDSNDDDEEMSDEDLDENDDLDDENEDVPEDDNPDENDSDGSDITDGEDDPDEEDEDVPEDDNPDENDSDGSDITDGEEDDGDSEELDDGDSDDVDANAESDGDTDLDADTTGSGKMKIQIETDGSTVSVTANKSESTNYLNIFGRTTFNKKMDKSVFRSLIESNIKESSKLLAESSLPDNAINMDTVLGESIIQYTLLETLNTSKLFDIRQKDISRIVKYLNFR